MLTIEGTVNRNSGGGASRNLVTQIPLIVTEFPEIAECHPGTMNVKLDCCLIVLRPDHRTRLIDWHPSQSPGEIFELLRIQFELPAGQLKVPAWIYLPSGSPHRMTPQIHEVIGPNFGDCEGVRVRIHIDREYLRVPYKFPTILVF